MRALSVGWFVAAAVVGLTVSDASAADKPLYQPAPAWVKPAPAIDAIKLNDDAPILLTFDHQDRLADGVTWSYADVASRLASPEIVAQAGTLSLPWNPAKGDLIVHRVEIIRAARHIDLLAAGKRFEVIRREQRLERQQLDGQLTATMPIEGLQVGDVLRVTVSVTRREPTFAGQMQTVQPVPQTPLRVGYARARLLWPAKANVRWRLYAAAVTPAVTSAGGDRELTVEGALPKAPELPADAPLRYRKPPLLEASTFADWGAVSSLMAPLYVTTGLVKPGGALAGEIARIAAASKDPTHRAAAALQLVQEQVRYLFNGLDNGNYAPQSPELTWALRYGDCKAKTLLLLAMLHELGVDAEPVLASSALGDLLPERLPAPAAFDHVLVRATIAGETFWLDGTGRGARYADLRDTPPLHWVLPLRTAGTALMPVPARAPAHASVSVKLDLDQSAGLSLPTLVHAVVTLRGPAAEMVGLAKTQGSKEQKDQAVGQMIGSMVGGEVALSSYTLSYDPVEAIATVDASGLVSTRWTRKDGRYRMTLDRTVGALQFEPDRARPAWRAIPVDTGAPDSADSLVRVRLPSGLTGFTLDGDASLTGTLGGTSIQRSASVGDGFITLEEHDSLTGAEIAPAEVTAARARVALAKTRLLTAVAPANTPARWSWARSGRQNGRFKQILAAYAQAIADYPQLVSPYVNRANFNIGIFDWRAAMPDLDKAITLEPTAALYLQRAQAHRVLGEGAKAIADAEAARKLDPASGEAIAMLGEYDIDAGRRDVALARVQERIDAGGDGKDDMLQIKADLQSRAGDGAAAVATLDGAIATKPGSPALLNARCWTKAKHSLSLDTALKDCTRSIELSEYAGATLDSRALVYLRLNRLDEALADLNAALDLNPNQAGSLYLRGVVLTRLGRKAEAADDLNAVREMAPSLPTDYKRFGVSL